MTGNLHVCVDESGRKSQDSCYTVAGCWFVSEYSNPQNALMGTKDSLLTTVQQITNSRTQPSEIKSAKLQPPTLGAVVSDLRKQMFEDESLVTGRLPWSMQTPVCFTIATFHGDVCRDVLADQTSRLKPFEVMQVMGLSSILTPLSDRRALLDQNAFDSVRVLLDAKTWENAADVVDASLSVDDVSFAIRDSKRTPGIQLADLAAYSWRRNLTRGDCETASGLLHDLRFAR